MAINHFDEATIELYVLGAHEVDGVRADIEKHLLECGECMELMQDLTQYYAEVAEQQSRERTSRSSSIVRIKNAIARRWDRGYSLEKPPRRSLGQHVVLSVKAYPARWTSAFLVLVVLLVLLLPRTGAQKGAVSYARAEKEYLVAYDATGLELWRHHIGYGYDFGSLDPRTVGDYLVTADVDHDGLKEVFATFGWLPENVEQNVIVCYNNDGTERWRFLFHRNMIFGRDTVTDSYKVGIMRVGDFLHCGEPQVVAIAQHSPSYPSALTFLRGKDKKLLGEYWHPGYMQALISREAEGDSVSELVVGGENNSLDQAFLAVLDPRVISGYGPSAGLFRASGIQVGKEKYYVLFPRTDLKQFESHKRNVLGFLVQRSGNLLLAAVSEWLNDNTYAMEYYFDTSMRCVKVEQSDKFSTMRRKLELEGKLKPISEESYNENLRSGVRYWDGEKFVRRLVMNGNYSESFAK